MPKITIDQLKQILEAGCLSVPHVYSDNRQDEPYVCGHQLAVDQVLEIIKDGWYGGNTPRLRHEVTRKMPREGDLA